MNAQALPEVLKKNKRVAMFVGFTCINDCRFCVTADKRGFPDKTTEQIKEELLAAHANSAIEVVFTGGECTIREDIFELVHFAKNCGYQFIQIQSNGRKFSSMDFCKKMLLSGMTEFSPALHGHTANLHDYLTRRKGSFRQTVLGIYNMRKLTGGKLKIITNTVINKYNYKFLPAIAKLLVQLGVNQYQFAFVHAMGNALKSFEKIVPRKTDVAPYLKNGLDIGIERGIKTMAEAMPLCLMKGYEKCVSEFYIPPTEIRERGEVVEDFCEVRIKFGKTKFPQCKICNYDNICEGPWKEYPQHYGDAEFQPIVN